MAAGTITNGTGVFNQENPELLTCQFDTMRLLDVTRRARTNDASVLEEKFILIFQSEIEVNNLSYKVNIIIQRHLC